MTGPTIRETNRRISVVLHLPTVASQDSKGEAERVGRRFVLLKDKNPSGELVLTQCRKSRGKHAVAKEGGKGYVIYQTDSEATVATLQNRYAVLGGCYFSVLFASKFNPAEFICGALCQEGRHIESSLCVCAECTFIWQVSHPLCLPIRCSRHSAAKAAAFQTRLAGRGLRGLTAKLAAQGIQGTLTPAFAHSHAFIPLFLPLTTDWLHSFPLAGINLPLEDVICSLSVLSLSCALPLPHFRKPLAQRSN